jgi:hypothetical protein
MMLPATAELNQGILVHNSIEPIVNVKEKKHGNYREKEPESARANEKHWEGEG